MELAEKSKVQKRRGRNEGSVRFIENRKLYEARYAIGMDDNGHTIFKSIFAKRKSDVMTRMRDAISALGKGTYVDPSGRTLIDWCRNWYEVHKSPNIKANTRAKYLLTIKRLEKSDIANMKLKDITQEIVQKYYNKLIKVYSEETIRATHSLINGALEKAEEVKLVNKNVARSTSIPLSDDGKHDIKALNQDEYEKFLKYMAEHSHYYMFALFMSNTGLRPGETVALSRKDIDLVNNTVRVSKTFVKALNAVQNSTKTTSSNRTVPVPEDTMRLLREYMFKQKNQAPDAPLFQSMTGGYMSSRNTLRQFKIAGAAIGCPWMTIHTLRHTYASRLFKEKVDVKVISRLLGHKDVSTTYDIYIHFIDNIVEESVQVLNFGTPDLLPKNIRIRAVKT